MLEEILAFIHNYFVKEIHRGMFKISDGQFLCDFLQDGQYFRIRGSIFNDGVYQYPVSDLANETFTGEIWAMAVPPSVIALVGEIETWQTQYEAEMLKPYSSENIQGVYSYTKATSNKSGNKSGLATITWRDVFAARLNKWRKIHE